MTARILLVEDRENDALLIERELRRADLDFILVRVQTEVDFRKALREFDPDVVLTDHSLPQFSATHALRISRQERPATPVIIVTGSLDEETAVTYLKSGATDYILKQSLTRLGPAVHRALVTRRVYEDKLRADERAANLAAIVAFSDDAIVRTTLDGVITSWNPGAERLYGFAADEALGQPAWFLAPPDRVAEERRVLDLIRHGERVEPYETVRVTKEGTPVQISNAASPIRDAEGMVIGVSIIARDISERKRAEEALRRSEARLARAQAIAHLGSWEIDLTDPDHLDRSVSWCSPETLRILGYPPGRMPHAGELFLHAVPPAEVPRVREAMIRAIAEGLPYAIEHSVVRPDGTTRIVDVQAEIELGLDGQPARMIGTVQDITDRQRLETQLQQAQKMEAVGRLAGGVAHDFNNLLTVILGISDLLLESLGTDHESYSDAEEIQKAARRAADLTRQLLAFGRRQVLQTEVLNVNQVVAEMEKMLCRLIGEDVELRTVLDPQLAAVRADPGQLAQVIANLAVNARDAMPKGGKLTLETSNVPLDELYVRDNPTVKPGEYVMLAVSDTGVGMDRETQSHLFEPFFTTKEKGKGTGLGLATVYGIVKQSGGYVWVYSEPGHGTTFKIYLPQVTDQLSAPRRSASYKLVPRGTETVLLVEDEEAVRRLARKILESLGYAVLAADCGPEALKLAASHTGPLDILVTDVIMPGMSGREVAEQLTRERPTLKVLYLSGYTDDAIIQRGVLTAESAFLQKPFTAESLGRKVRETVEK